MSCAEFVELLSAVLLYRDRTVDDIIAAMEERHNKRQQVIEYVYKCQGAHHHVLSYRSRIDLHTKTLK